MRDFNHGLLVIGAATMALVAGCSNSTALTSPTGSGCSGASTTQLAAGAHVVIDPSASGGCVRLPAAGASGARHLLMAFSGTAEVTDQGLEAPFLLSGTGAALTAATARLKSPSVSIHLSPGAAVPQHAPGPRPGAPRRRLPAPGSAAAQFPDRAPAGGQHPIVPGVQQHRLHQLLDRHRHPAARGPPRPALPRQCLAGQWLHLVGHLPAGYAVRPVHVSHRHHRLRPGVGHRQQRRSHHSAVSRGEPGQRQLQQERQRHPRLLLPRRSAARAVRDPTMARSSTDWSPIRPTGPAPSPTTLRCWGSARRFCTSSST